MVYYNEFDKQKAAWLRELIVRGIIAPGDVDERSIHDVRPDDLRGYRQCHFFAGIGIWSYALRLAGWEDDREVWTGSCPCPSFSAAGKGQGFDDPRHLWPNWFGLARERRPPVIFGEQVDDAIGHGWLDLVQTDLEGQAYAVGKAVLGACSVGAPHIRQRLYFCADTAHSDGRRGERGAETGTGKDGERRRGSSGGGALVGGPEPLYAERWPLLFNGSDGRDGQDGGRQETHSQPGAHGQDGGEPGDGDLQRGRQQRLLAEDCGTGDPCDPSGAGLSDGEPQDIRGAGRRIEGRATSESGISFGACSDTSGERVRATGSGGAGSPTSPLQESTCERERIRAYARQSGATGGFWRDCDWWYGKDGKHRPIERGLLPLAHGSPTRVLRLRGYGDGIVAQAAAAFVKAYIDLKR